MYIAVLASETVIPVGSSASSEIFVSLVDIDKRIQLTAFRGQLRLAKELDLPGLVHDRTANQRARRAKIVT